MKGIMKCCICGKELKGFADCNNPSPVSDNPEDACCNDCNLNVVIPARIELAKKGLFGNMQLIPEETKEED